MAAFNHTRAAVNALVTWAAAPTAASRIIRVGFNAGPVAKS
jgi:hypothetical protein